MFKFSVKKLLGFKEIEKLKFVCKMFLMLKDLKSYKRCKCFLILCKK